MRGKYDERPVLHESGTADKGYIRSRKKIRRCQMIGVAGYLSTSIAEPCDFSAAFCAAALDERAAVAHAQRVARCELRRAAVMAERVGEQQLADVLGNLLPLPQRLNLRDALVAAELVFLHLLGDEPGDHLLAYAVDPHLPGHLLVF